MSRITFDSEEKTARPISAKKLAANRANSKKSTGPRSKEGKSKVAQNARKHGCSQSALLPSECTATYQIHLDEMHQSLRPQTPSNITSSPKSARSSGSSSAWPTPKKNFSR